MFLPQISIQRPILASMMSIALIIVGLVSVRTLPVREVPDIDPPIVNITTAYTGASARVVETEVTERIEEVVNGIEGIKRLTSESREEVSNITVEFELWRDVDVAAQDVRDRVSRVRGGLPDEIEEPIIAKQESDASPIMWVALYSDRHSTLELTDIGDKLLKDPLQTVAGVSSVILGGAKRYAIRIRLDSDLMAAKGVSVIDIETALRTQNVEIPSGRIENISRELTIQTLGELKTPEEFNRLVIRRDGSDFVRLQDIGIAEEGVEDERSVARYNSRPAMGLGVVKQSQANTIDVAKGVQAELLRQKKYIPEGVETFIAYDESIFVESAINEVWRTLAIAFFFVVATIFLFLKSGRSTIVPALTIPVSIVATFGVLQLMGYSVNILTMLALILAIGLVVDDSIVVLENIYRHIEEGKKPMDAAKAAMKEISFAVIATTVSLVAVFLPLAYQKSITGILFTEFAVTLCGAVVISTFVALSLTPSVAARILKPIPKDLEPQKPNFLARLSRRYERLLTRCLNNRPKVGLLFLLLLVLTAFFYTQLETEFLPNEDKGRLFNLAIAPEGSTSEYTDRMVAKMESIIKEFPEVAGYFSAVALPRQGPGKASEGLMFVRFNQERDRSVQDILAGPRGLRARFFTEVEGAFALAILPKSVGRGFNQSYQLVLKSHNLDALDDYSSKLVQHLQQSGKLQGVRSQFQFSKPELQIEIDRERSAALGVTVADIARTLQILFGGRDLSTIKVDGEQYDVIVQFNRESRLTPSDVDGVYVRNDMGRLVQLSNLITYKEAAGPNAIYHFNRMRSASIEGTPIGDAPLGEIIASTEAYLNTTLPDDFRYEWGGEAADLKDSGSDTIFVIFLALITIYIVLAAQFESLVHPLTVMVTLPLAALGAFGSLWILSLVNGLGSGMYGWANYAPDPPFIASVLSAIVPRIPSMTINVYSQIGIVLLMGLVTKNSILLVEFANQQMAQGKTAREAMMQAAAIRFRPILMTAMGTITGILPIAIGFGAGAESRRPMGVAAVGGMIAATLLTFFIVPVVYTWFDDLRRKVGGKDFESGKVSLFFLGFVSILLFITSVSFAEEGESDKETLPLSGADATSPEAAHQLSLALAIQTALKENPEIREAKEKIERERGARVEIRSGVLPQLEAKADYQKIDKDLLESFNNNTFGTDESWNARVELTQPLYAGGKSVAALKQQTLVEQSAEAELERVILDVLLEVKTRFYDVLLAQSQLLVRDESTKLLAEELRSERNKFQAGEISNFSVLRAEVELANSKTPLIRSRNLVQLNYEQLKRAIGASGESPFSMGKSDELKGKLEIENFNIVLEEALVEAKAQRPLIKKLEALVEAAENGVDVQRASYFPSLEINGSYGVEKSRFSDEIDETIEGWRAGLSANWMIFDSFATAGRVSQARSLAALAKNELRRALLEVEVEIRQSYYLLLEAKALVKASTKVVAQAEESLRLARNRVQVGAGIQLDVLNAQVALTDARSNAVQAQYDHSVAVARLQRGLGRKVFE